jgi:alkylation response protein AidB-like acyl-CoA dehydrogenase
MTLMPPPMASSPALATLRSQVRQFIAEAYASGLAAPDVDNWLSGWNEGFTRALAERGWVGMTIPREYGGQGRGFLERFVVTEELLAAGAPVAAHWIADRQAAPSLLRFGSRAQKRRYLPRIARGELYWAIGMSEPDSGSDLASVRTRAERVDGGWRVTGTKLWTSGAHRAHAFFALVRTAPPASVPPDPVPPASVPRTSGQSAFAPSSAPHSATRPATTGPAADRRTGLSQMIVELDAPGVRIQPIRSMTGAHHFNEVQLDSVFVPDDLVLGTVGDGWHQVTSELAYERSGPERFLSTFPLLARLVAHADQPDVGRFVARIGSLHQMSQAIAGALGRHEDVAVAAAVVKVLGTTTEGDIADLADRSTSDGCVLEDDRIADGVLTRYDLAAVGGGLTEGGEVLGTDRFDTDPDTALLRALLARSVTQRPGFTLRGGTTEILRGVIARGLGLR